MKEDDTKFYSHIDSETNAKTRKKRRGEHPITGSRSQHIITCDPQGNFVYHPFTRDTNIIETIRGKSAHNDVTEQMSSEIDKVVLEENELGEDDPECFQLSTDTIYELLESGMFAATWSEAKAHECFYLIEIVEKNKAGDYIEDERGHVIGKGEQYAHVRYLEKDKEVGRGRSKKVLYKYSKDDRDAFICAEDIFITNIDLSANLSMNIEEYLRILSIVGQRVK